MKNPFSFLVLVFFAVGCTVTAADTTPEPAVIETVEPIDPVETAIALPEPGNENLKKISDVAVPKGYERVSTTENSFGHFLRHYPLRPEQDTVFLYDGSPKWAQDVHLAILDIDIGTRDLQQCADVVMHLRADYLRGQKRYNEIEFEFLKRGMSANYKEYAKGDYSDKRYAKYLVYVYSYANTRSLRRQMTPVEVKDMQIGDVFVQAGEPYGHAMIVVDMAENKANGKKVFMLAQGFIPAQDAELVVNPNNSKLSPWYDLSFGDVLKTPQWYFYKEDLRRF